MARDSDSESEILRNLARNPHPQRLPTRDDSSSSRESSPESRRNQKRSFTPTSDDGNMEVPPIADDDTPPPEDRPIIREAVAFRPTLGATSLGPSTTLNTYQASLPASRNTMFLPGQSAPSKPSKPSKPRKRKNKDAFSTQTGRFRLESYTPTLPPSNTTTPTLELIASGTPSYPTANAHYPNTVSQMPAAVSATTPRAPLTTQALSSSGSIQHSEPSSALPASMNVFSSISIPQSRSQTPASSNDNAPGTRSVRPTGSAKSPSTNFAKSKSTSSSRSNTTASNSTSAHPQPRTSQPPSQATGSTPSAHYRRDYDLQTDLDFDTTTSTPIDSHPPPSPAVTPHPQPRARSDRLSIKHSQPSRPASRMVTILITDIRSGTEDHQLAEVIIPLKEADPHNPEYGFWANAQEVVDKLQSTPSRIEGSARAYTMRGKYRQFFLRVGEDGSYEAAPANVGVTAQRTLDVVVEAVPQPGRLPVPPKIPRDLQPSPEPESRSPSYHTRELDEQAYHGQRRKRYHSPSVETDGQRTMDYDGSGSPEGSRSHTPNDSVHHRSPKKSKINEIEDEISDSDAELFVTPLARGREWNYESPESDDEPEQVYNLIVKRVDPLLQMCPNWTQVFRAKTSLPRVSAYLQIYRVLQEMFDKYEGRRVPFRSNRNLRIERGHIIKAMQIEEDPDRLASDCTETLKLLALYGPEGTRLQDRRVEEMINDDSQPEYNAKPQKRFLRLLREIDRNWVQGQSQHEETAESTAPSGILPPS